MKKLFVAAAALAMVAFAIPADAQRHGGRGGGHAIGHGSFGHGGFRGGGFVRSAPRHYGGYYGRGYRYVAPCRRWNPYMGMWVSCRFPYGYGGW